MSIVHVIDTLAEWAKKSICSEISLKVPPQNNDANDSGYKYKLANPHVFPMYMPTGDKLPDLIDTEYPALLVRFLKAQDDLVNRTSAANVQFLFCVWDPGQHREDVFLPNGDGTYSRQEDKRAEFDRNGTGWRDVWNFVDLARRKLESVNSIGCCTIDRHTPIEFGPLMEQEAIVDAYPFWYAEMNFRVTYPLMRHNEDNEIYL